MLLTLAAVVAATTSVAVPTDTSTPPTVKTEAQPAPAKPDDKAALEQAKDAEADLKSNRFYNKPGATRADYNTAWQECRLIARGSHAPSPTYYNPYIYNPSVSPLAAGIGAGIGAVIAQIIIDAQLRKSNRRQCLLVHGWRLVELDSTETTRIDKMSAADRDAYFNQIVGATDVQGKHLTEWNNDFAEPKLAGDMVK